jgi:hypothetical protein
MCCVSIVMCDSSTIHKAAREVREIYAIAMNTRSAAACIGVVQYKSRRYIALMHTSETGRLTLLSVQIAQLELERDVEFAHIIRKSGSVPTTGRSCFHERHSLSHVHYGAFAITLNLGDT